MMEAMNATSMGLVLTGHVHTCECSVWLLGLEFCFS